MVFNMKNNKAVLIIVIVLVLVVIASKSLLQPKSNEVVQYRYSSEISKDYNNLKNYGKPGVAAITYDADCCPGTKQFFEEYNETVEQIFESYGSKISTVFINFGDIPENEVNNFNAIVKEHGITVIPAILVFDAKGEFVHLVEGPIVEDDLKKMIDEVLE